MSIRVVHVLNSLLVGGMEKGVTTVTRLSAGTFDHTIVCLTRSGPMEESAGPGMRVVEMHKPAGHSIRFVRRLARTLRDLRPDVVHTRNWGGMDGIVAGRLAGIRGIVHGEHGWTVDDPHGHNRKRRFVRRLLSRWVREFTCVSRQIEEWLRASGVRKPVTRIRNGVDTDRYRPGAAPLRAELGIGPTDFVVGVVGRLDPIKDHGTLFRAFARQEPGSHLLVVGDGSERERLGREAPRGARLLGERADIPTVLRALDLFVLPSRNEGISNTILEAMASGLPVVASRVGGNEELVEEGTTGVLFPAGDTEALASILARYRADPGLRRSQGEAGRRRALGCFSLSTMVSAYEAVWSRVCLKPRG